MEEKIKQLLYYCLANDTRQDYFKIKAQLFIVLMKSLMPFENKIGCGVFYPRLNKELELLNYYGNNDKENKYHYLGHKFSNNIQDDFIECSILSLALSNTEWNIIVDEVIKNIIYYHLDENNIISSIVLTRILFEYFNDSIDEENLIQNIKESLIAFSYKDFILINFNHKIDAKTLIRIERNKIFYLENIEKNFHNGNIPFQRYKIYEHIILNEYDENINESNKKIIDNFASYILKLRKGKIPPEKLKIDLNKIRPFKAYLTNKTFVHPLLGRCMIVSKNLENKIIIKTKTGLIKVVK